MDGFWEKAAELNIPVNVHIADHPSAWRPPDVYRTPIFQQYNQYGGDGLSYEEIHTHFPRLLEKHPNTTFIACHPANLGNDLGRLSTLLDQHSNLYLDISARDYEVGHQPRGAAKFLTKYQDLGVVRKHVHTELAGGRNIGMDTQTLFYGRRRLSYLRYWRTGDGSIHNFTAYAYMRARTL